MLVCLAAGFIIPLTSIISGTVMTMKDDLYKHVNKNKDADAILAHTYTFSDE